MTQRRFALARPDRALSPAEKMDARAALRLLEGSGITLEGAAKRALQGRAALERVSVETAADRFLRVKVASKRWQTAQFYESKLRAIRDEFGERQMDEVSRADFRAWIATLPVTETTKRGYVRVAKALWRWAAHQEPPLAGPPPTTGMETSSRMRGRSIGYLTVAEVEAALAGAREWRPALALMLFAGVRVEEVAGQGKPAMTWRCVDVVDRCIRVPAECAKTGAPRLIQNLPPAIWHWLGAPGPDARAISPGRSVGAVAWLKKRVPRAWPADAVRHTFATYAVALTTNPGAVAGWLGHTGSLALLAGHYDGQARRAEGEAYFALAPVDTRAARAGLLGLLAAKAGVKKPARKKAPAGKRLKGR